MRDTLQWGLKFLLSVLILYILRSSLAMAIVGFISGLYFSEIKHDSAVKIIETINGFFLGFL
jgi:hypothetical protein